MADINYEYFSELVRKHSEENKNLKVLDYGCGNGDIVKLTTALGIDSYGVDIFYAGSDHYSIMKDPLFETGKIMWIEESGDLPFQENFFDIILSNQVFEHVRDMKYTLDRLHKVLNDDGKMFLHFPFREIFREGHTGIPFIHWFPKDSKFRYYYVLMLRKLGFGTFAHIKDTPEKWTLAAIE